MDTKLVNIDGYKIRLTEGEAKEIFGSDYKLYWIED